MKNWRKSLILLVVSTFLFLLVDPATAAWGAGWRTGSVVGSGTVTGLQKAKNGGASVLSIAAHFGAKFCFGEDHSAPPNPKSNNQDKDKDDCKDKKKSSNTNTTAPVLPGAAITDPGVIPGIVFCKQLGGDDDDHHIKRGIAHASLPINFNGNVFIPGSQIDSSGAAPFEIHDAVDQVTLNMLLSAAALCPTSSDDDHHSSSSPSTSTYTTPQWTIVDFVPQQFSTSLSASDSMGRLLTRAIYDCSIPWTVLDTLRYKQSEPYTCTVRLNQ